MEDAIVRFQDYNGRGPWKKGLSHIWLADDNPLGCPTIMSDFKNLEKLISGSKKYFGCAVRISKINLWFSINSMKNLYKLGFILVDCSDCEIVAESDYQLIISSNIPLKYLNEFNKEFNNAKPL